MSTPIMSPHAAWVERPALVGPRDLSDERLRQIEMVVLAAVGLGGLALLVTQPAARRLASRLVRVGLTTWLPAVVVREFKEAWRRAEVAPPTHEGV